MTKQVRHGPSWPVDLHLHTSASDGCLTPGEVVALAASRRVSVIAVCDHDTTSGLDEAARAARRAGLKLVPGVELSAWDEGPAHLLGLFLDPSSPSLRSHTQHMAEIREQRIELICARLGRLGIELRPEDVLARVKGTAAGRPHVARLLVEQGVVRDSDEAFERYLGLGKPAYVGLDRISVARTVDIVKRSGGLPVLAHPLLWSSVSSIERWVRQEGVRGLEVEHPSHDAWERVQLARLAARLGIGCSGGSDFHGEGLANRALPGDTGLSLAAFELLADQARREAAAWRP